MSVIFQNNTVSLGSGTLFSDVTFAGWKVSMDSSEKGVTMAIRRLNIKHNDGSKSVYVVPIETHAILPIHAMITING